MIGYVNIRSRLGSSFVELAIGLMVLIPIALVIFDLCVIVICVQMNDSTCREAARVAAMGSPLDAQTRAQTMVDQANNHCIAASNFTLVSVVSTVTPADIATLANAGGGPVKGNVTVATEVSVRPVVVQWVYSGKGPLVFRSQQSFPFTYVVPSTIPASFLLPEMRYRSAWCHILYSKPILSAANLELPLFTVIVPPLRRETNELAVHERG